MTEKAEQVGADLGGLGAILAPFDGVSGEFAAISGGQLTVNHDTVLQAGKIITREWQSLHDLVQRKLSDLTIRTIGHDKVSLAATDAWTKILVTNPDSYAKRIQQYVQGLRDLADQLKTAAQQYGFTEEEITAAFGVPQ